MNWVDDNPNGLIACNVQELFVEGDTFCKQNPKAHNGH